MVNKSSRIKLDKKDHLRALLTDTAPSDVPIIFSNDGFYIQSQRIKSDCNSKLSELITLLYKKIIAPQNMQPQSYPHKYKIRKDETNLRTLSLLHPRAQLNIVNFYKEWNESITFSCSISPFSIRAPIKIGNSFYSKHLTSDSKYKEIRIDTLENEINRKYASSFFSYRGVDRLYKIYSDDQYLLLEKQYPIMWLMDISNCFPSIYTHSISWAVKTKDFIKKHVEFSNQFCQTFDTLMQRTNNNETNGIPVGSEVSRIFAEIILQSIDLQIIKTLEYEYSYILGSDYSVLRYVDDYIVFARSDIAMQKVSNIIKDSLSEYNLYINDTKLKTYRRPFCTEKSSIIIGLDEIINDMESKLFSKRKISDRTIIYSNKIRYKNKFSHSFISKVKRLCLSGKGGYADVSSYLVSVCSNRIEQLINSIKSYPEADHSDSSKSPLCSRTAISILMDIMFFFYSVHATISASNRLAKTIVFVDEFLKEYYPQYLPFIRTEVMNNINALTLDMEKNDRREGYISLERLNIVLATTTYGKNYLVSSRYFDILLKDFTNLTYFNIICLLYYFQENEIYADSISKLEEIISCKFINSFELQKDSENAHLFLDILSCPHLSIEFRKKHLEKFYTESTPPITKTQIEIEQDIELLNETFWFVKWKGLDLLKQIERKELISVY